ncbi:phage scaffolding protein [Paenibacillus sp. FSL H8-0260]|uniref:phage scaffolding protein n=1 Tax=Paenibacillus sp. FSL H8-0260 TaxID=2921380 RepID=UPI00324B9CF7
MDWLKELLKKLGVEDSKIDGAIADAGKEIPKHFVPKSQYNEVSTAKQQAEKDVADRDKQIEDLSKAAGLSDDLKKQIDQLKSDNKTAKDKYDADLQQIKLDNAITAVLTGKVHNEKVVTGLIDKTKLIIGDDGNLVGLDEQLTGLKSTDAYLFKPEADPQQQQPAPSFRGTTPLDATKPAGTTPEGYNAGKSIAEQRNQGSEKK